MVSQRACSQPIRGHDKFTGALTWIDAVLDPVFLPGCWLRYNRDVRDLHFRVAVPADATNGIYLTFADFRAASKQEGSRALVGDGVRTGEVYFSVKHSRFLNG